MRPPALGSMVNLGHVETILADDVNWDIRYLIIAARTWLPGKLVQLAPYAVTGIDWPERRVSVNVNDMPRPAVEKISGATALTSPSATSLPPPRSIWQRRTRGSGLSISWSGKRNFAG